MIINPVHWLRRIVSYLTQLVVERASSKLNPSLKVALWRGRYILNARNANYSFGGLHELFLRAFKHIGMDSRPFEKVLILGFGTGSVASILVDKYDFKGQMVGVEADPKVIELGEKYFDIHRYPNLELMCADGLQYVAECDTEFDLIVVDVFTDLLVPEPFEDEEFLSSLKALLRPKGLLLFNKIVHTHALKKQLPKLHRSLESCFGKVEVFKTMGINRVFIVDRKRRS